MKAYSSGTYGCGVCGYVMAVNSERPTLFPEPVVWAEARYLCCVNEECSEFQKKYKIPLIELEPYEEE